MISIAVFLWLTPKDAQISKVRRFNAFASASLAVLCFVVLALLVSRAHALSLALIPFAYFLVIFVPSYVAAAGLLRSRSLSKFHDGGGSTV